MTESLVLGLASIGLGALGLWLGYRARSQPFRERLYQEQIKVVIEALEAADRLHTACARITLLKDQSRIDARQAALDLGRSFFGILAKASAILPLSVWGAFTTFAELARTFLHNPNPTELDYDQLSEVWARLPGPIRHFVGVEPLTEENLRAFGASREEVKAFKKWTP